MRVADLDEIISVDSKIQSLMNDLQTLYTKRQDLCEQEKTIKNPASQKRKSSKRPLTVRLASISKAIIDDIDLTLPEPSQPSRRHRLFGQ